MGAQQGPHPPVSSARRREWVTGWRLALRMAHRELRRHRGQSLLTALLVGIPVLVLVGGTTLTATSNLSPSESVPVDRWQQPGPAHGATARGRPPIGVAPHRGLRERVRAGHAAARRPRSTSKNPGTRPAAPRSSPPPSGSWAVVSCRSAPPGSTLTRSRARHSMCSSPMSATRPSAGWPTSPRGTGQPAPVRSSSRPPAHTGAADLRPTEPDHGDPGRGRGGPWVAFTQQVVGTGTAYLAEPVDLVMLSRPDLVAAGGR